MKNNINKTIDYDDINIKTSYNALTELKTTGSFSKGKNNMSCAFAISHPTGIYMFSDTRIKIDNKKNDNYIKAGKIPNEQIAIISTGTHPIGSHTIRDIIENVQSKTINNIIPELNYEIQGEKFPSGMSTIFVIIKSQKEHNKIKNKYNGIKVIKDNYPEIKYEDPVTLPYYEIVSLGEEWATDLISSLTKDDIKSSNNIKQYGINLMKYIIEFSNKFTINKTIGGNIFVMHLTPENYTEELICL